MSLGLIPAISVLFLQSFSAQAVTSINARPPYFQYAQGTQNVQLWYAAFLGGATGLEGSGAGWLNRDVDATRNHIGFTVIDTTAATINQTQNLITVDVFSNKTFTPAAGQNLVATITATSTTDPVPLMGASIASGSNFPAACAQGPCQGALTYGSPGTFASATYQNGSVLRLSFSLGDLCAMSEFTTLCTSTNTVIGGITAPQAPIVFPLFVTIGLVPDGTSQGPPMAPDTGSVLPGAESPSSFSINLVSSGPDLTGAGACGATPTTTIPDPDFYFPGDGEITLNPPKYGANVGSFGVPLLDLLFIAANATTITPLDSTSAAYAANSPITYVDPNNGGPKVEGFSDTDSTGSTNKYQGAVYAENQAGILSKNCWGNANPIQARQIDGILTKSRCFIATAAYHSGDVYPVMMLRQFRDQILSRFSWGRTFVKYYYQSSPPLALWTWHRPWARMIALKLLTPLEIAAFLILHPLLAMALMVGLCFLLFGVKRLQGLVFLIVILSGSFAAPSRARAEDALPAGGAPEASPTSNSPYIDKIKKKMAEEDAKTSTPAPESYTEKLKKKYADPKATNESYSEHVKKKLSETDPEGSKDQKSNYIEEVKSKLPKEEDDSRSVIADVKSGNDKLKRSEKPPINTAVSLKVGVAPQIKVDAGGNHSFQDIYGTGWNPDFLLHFEHQFFHSENFGSFGMDVETGATYSGGFGQFVFAFNGSNVSHTSFSLIQIPVLVGGIYRFNLFRVVRPYAGANAGSMIIVEMRNDQQHGHRDYSFIYSLSGGVSFLMDFLEPHGMQDSYDSIGVQHIYLFAEFILLRTLSGTVNVSRSGLYSGFTFEF